MNIPKKIPTLLGLALFVMVVGGIIFSVEHSLRAPSVASGSYEPKQIRVTNITHASFTISWTTEKPVTGIIHVASSGKPNRVYYDERDQEGSLGTYMTHSITVRDAKPQTHYTFIIVSNGKKFSPKGEEEQSVTTADELPLNSGGLEPAYGSVRSDTNLAVDGALVYLGIDGSQELSTLTKPSGQWIIPLNQLRTEDLTSYLPIIERMDETIRIQTGSGESFARSDTLNDSPVPDMSIGKEYDFRKQQAKTNTNTPIALRSGQQTNNPVTTKQLPVGGAVLGDSASANYTFSLQNPKQNAYLSTAFPLIEGTGVPGTFIGISLGMTNPITGSVRVSPGGTWNYTPTRALSPGKQSVTVSGINNAQKTAAITHLFEILKSGTQVLGSATPSATLTPAISISPTSTDPAEPSPTATIAAEPPPISGTVLPTLIIILMGTLLMVSGLVATR